MADAPKSTDRSPWWLALAGIIGAIIGAAISGGFNYLSHQGDLDAKMIELSVGILRAEPTPETTPLREWAIDVIDKRAKFSFNAPQRSALLKKQLPYAVSWEHLLSLDKIDELSRRLKRPLPPEK